MYISSTLSKSNLSRDAVNSISRPEAQALAPVTGLSSSLSPDVHQPQQQSYPLEFGRVNHVEMVYYNLC
jgi:hypothetical protein